MVRCAPVFTVFRCGGAGGRCGGCANWGRGMVAVRGSETGPEGAGQEFGAKRMRTIVILRDRAVQAPDRAVLVSFRAVSAGCRAVSAEMYGQMGMDAGCRRIPDGWRCRAVSGDVRTGGGCRAQGRASAGGTKKPPRRREALGSEAAEAAARAVISRGGWSPCRGR